MTLSKEQIARVQRLVDDEWDSEDEFDQFFNSISDPEELHLFAHGFNWDCGVEELNKILEHPLCDKGTALLIYWRGKPGYYLRFNSREEVPEYNREGYDLSKLIEDKISNNHFGAQRFSFDPAHDHGHDLTPKQRELKHGIIPAYMYPETKSEPEH